MAYNESPSYVKALDPARFPITPYVVGPVGFAGYQTIQAALTAADGAGGGAVWIMPGSYTEDLTLYPTSQIIGAVSNSDAPLAGTVIISGVHTPPSTGFVSFTNVFLSSATDIFNSAAAGTAILVLENCTTNCTSGYTFNVPNWTASGYLVQFNCQQADVDNGCVNNSGGAIIFFETSNVGQGTGKTMVTSGFVHFNEVDLMCPWNCTTGTILDLDTVTFSYTVTFSNNTTGTIRWGSFITGGSPAITMSSSAAVSLLGGIVNSSNNPAIAGAGAGTFTLSNVTFVDNAVIAGTLTTSGVGGYMPGAFGNAGDVFTSNGPGVVPSFQSTKMVNIVSAPIDFTATGLTTLFTPEVGKVFYITRFVDVTDAVTGFVSEGDCSLGVTAADYEDYGTPAIGSATPGNFNTEPVSDDDVPPSTSSTPVILNITTGVTATTCTGRFMIQGFYV